MILSFIILLLLQYFKIVVSVWLFFVVLAVFESNKILKIKPLLNDAGFFNSYIRPQRIHPQLNNYPLITLLYKIYCNFIFEITYTRIKYPNYWYNFFNFKNVFITILLSLFGLNRIFLKIVKFLFFSKKFKNLEDFLIVYFQNANDTRIIIYYNGCWVTNPNFEIIFQNIIKKCPAASKVENLKEILEKTNNMYFNTQTYSEVQYAQTQLINNKYSQTHLIYKNILNSNLAKDYVGIQTSYTAACDKGFYGKKIIIDKYLGLTKLSTLLLQNTSTLKIISETKHIPNANILTGAVLNGYNKNLVNPSIQQQIETRQKCFDFFVENIQGEISFDEKLQIYNAYINETQVLGLFL